MKLEKIFVIKNNNKKEEFNINKIRTVVDWGTEGLNVNPLELEANITSNFKNDIRTSDIQQILINTSN